MLSRRLLTNPPVVSVKRVNVCDLFSDSDSCLLDDVAGDGYAVVELGLSYK